MALEDEGFGYDRFGFERESLYLAYLAARQLYRRWFRVDSSGHENVPRTGRAILAGNHSGLLPFDGAMLAVDMMEKLNPPRALRSIVDHFAFAFPYVGLFMYRTGQVPGTPRNFRDLLEREQLVLVFPEGSKGIVKPYSERYRLQAWNVGFVEIALETEAPIVPFAVIGAEEQAPVLFASKGVGKRLGLPVFPFTPTFPWFGVAGLVPYPVEIPHRLRRAVPPPSRVPEGGGAGPRRRARDRGEDPRARPGNDRPRPRDPQERQRRRPRADDPRAHGPVRGLP